MYIQLHIDNLLTTFYIQQQNTEKSKSIQEQFQDSYEIWINKLNSFTELNDVIRFGAYILTRAEGRKKYLSLEFRLTKKRIAELKQKRQKVENNNKILKISGKKHQRRKRREAQKYIETMQFEIRKLKNKNKNINTFFYVQQPTLIRFRQQLFVKMRTFPRGLSSERIQNFAHFTADESHVGDQCAICQENYEIGRNMMRLDCDGRHTFCQVCIEGWFADHRRCPICRHMF